MGASLTIGLRNLRRRRLRTLLTFMMLLVGTGLIVFSVGLAEGTYQNMISLATKSYAGHFQVTAKGYHDKPSLYKNISHPGPILDRLRADPHVAAVTGRLETAGLISAGNQTAGVMMVGVDPVTERAASGLAGSIKDGGWLDAPAKGDRLPMVIGQGVAAKLKVKVGDEVSFITQAADGSMAADLYTVVGLVATGTDELDRGLVLIRLADAQELLVLPDRVQIIVGLAHNLDQVPAIGRAIKLPPGLVFLPWQKVMPSLDDTIKGDRAGLWIFLFIILAVVILGVTNTMMMAVLERTREFGVMLAIGATPGRVVAIILSETAWVTALGVAAGLAAGVIVNLITLRWGISIGTETITYGGVTIDVMRARNTLVGNFVFPGLIFVSGLVAGLLPALRAARLRPAEALRHD